ncbi:hypothetical protein E2C01_095013 [Portunus trituberculatus]|uniref:Uncharacterized protein n=1 Tax=Portunus trituberculatus TaxID=210409 RepID=A0A5B7JS12_PORTR|nr:hypothetical protein [Portunus trituberculatus]
MTAQAAGAEHRHGSREAASMLRITGKLYSTQTSPVCACVGWEFTRECHMLSYNALHEDESLEA